MLAEWTGEIVKKLHILGLTGKDLAAQLGYSDRYVSMVLNCRQNPKGAEQRFRDAVDELAVKKGANKGYQAEKVSLRDMRHNAKLTQAEVATSTYTEQPSVSLWESGTYEPDLQQVQILASLYSTTTDEIIRALREARDNA